VARWRFFVFGLVLVALVAARRAGADSRQSPPTPTEWVTDNAGFLKESTRASLSDRLGAYAATSGHQVLVWIGDTTGDDALEDFTVRAFQSWRVGRKGIDDGVVLFVFAKDHKVRIEVGYGLEDKIPDVAAGRIIRATIVPGIQAGDPDGAVSSGVEAIVARLDGKLGPGREPSPDRPRPTLSVVQAIFLALGLIALIAFLATHPTLAAFLLMSFFSGGRGRGGGWGGGGGGGGGFSGGGGSSGGGGASGSW
jgi:uncharacterized protein